MIDNNVPTKRNTTYTPDEVARKSSEELYEISFNKDQKAALDAKFAEGGGGGSSDLPEVTAADNGDVLSVVDGSWDKVERKDVCGFECTETETQVFSGTATPDESNHYTIAQSGFSLDETIKVVINGVEYVVDRQVYSGTDPGLGFYNFYNYGAAFDISNFSYDFSEYPFGLYYDPSTGFADITTETSASYSCAVYDIATQASATNRFKKAVQSVPSEFVAEWAFNEGVRTLLTSYGVIKEAFDKGMSIRGVSHQSSSSLVYDVLYILDKFSEADGEFTFVSFNASVSSSSPVFIEIIVINSNNAISYRSKQIS